MMSQLKKKNHCVEQVKHMFNHLGAPKDGVTFVPIKEAKRKQEMFFHLLPSSLDSTSSAT